MIAGMSAPDTRPLSPHLQVYRLPMTAKMSITHRLSGVILMGGMLLLAAWLVALAMGADAYAQLMGWAHHPLGLVILFGWSLAFYYHLCNGIRHLIWDMGYLFKLDNARRAGWVVQLATVILQAVTWWAASGGLA